MGNRLLFTQQKFCILDKETTFPLMHYLHIYIYFFYTSSLQQFSWIPSFTITTFNCHFLLPQPCPLFSIVKFSFLPSPFSFLFFQPSWVSPRTSFLRMSQIDHVVRGLINLLCSSSLSPEIAAWWCEHYIIEQNYPSHMVDWFPTWPKVLCF